jgi:hypothetical protein
MKWHGTAYHILKKGKITLHFIQGFTHMNIGARIAKFSPLRHPNFPKHASQPLEFSKTLQITI